MVALDNGERLFTLEAMSSEPRHHRDDPTAYTHIRFDRRGGEAHLLLHRPERRNALNHLMMAEIADAVRRVAADPAVRVLVLRGAGGAFSAGGDLGAMGDMPPPAANGGIDPLIPAYRQFGDVMLALDGLKVPVVSLIEGPAVGGGLGMACCSDVVIVHRNAKFGIPEPRAGFIPSQILPAIVRRIGEGATRYLAVTGRTIDGAQAVAWGIGHILCDSAERMEAALREVLADIRRMEPGALASVKGLVQACARDDDDAALLDRAAVELVGLLRAPAAREGIRAFMRKELPPWAREG